MWEIVFPYVLVQGGVVNSDEHGFLDGSCHIVLFSTQDLEIVHWCYTATDALMVEYWRRCLHVLFESLPKDSPRLSYIFFITANLPTAITVDDTVDACCGEIGCNEEYVGESGRIFGERFKEHMKTPSPIFHHQSISGRITSMDNFKILGREENNMARTIQEAMFIRVNNPTLNKNIGKYNLPHIWDRILFTIPKLKLKKWDTKVSSGFITLENPKGIMASYANHWF